MSDEKGLTRSHSVDMIFNHVMSRAALIRAASKQGERNLDTECGYPNDISLEDYWAMYRRNGIAKRVVNAMAEECWALPPEVYETEDQDETEFEKAWKDLVREKQVFHHLQRVDKLSGIGYFGALFLGFDDGKDPKEPVGGTNEITGEIEATKEHKLLFMRPFPDVAVEILKYQNDLKSARYGQPLMYKIKFKEWEDASGHATPSNLEDLEVHWSRIIHVCDGRETSEVFGTPRMEAVWNYILDIKKTLGGGAEMFYKGGFPGLSLEMMPEVAAALMALPEDEQDEIKKKMRQEMEQYQDGLQRFMAFIGVNAKSLQPQVADPSMHFDCQISAICITIGMPKRIFMGSERGELASNQDSENWNNKVKNRHEEYLTPHMVTPFAKRMIQCKVVPKPEQLLTHWPDVNAPGVRDQAVIATKLAEAMSKYVTNDVALLVPPLEFFTLVLGWDLRLAQLIVQKLEENGTLEQLGKMAERKLAAEEQRVQQEGELGEKQVQVQERGLKMRAAGPAKKPAAGSNGASRR